MLSFGKDLTEYIINPQIEKWKQNYSLVSKEGTFRNLEL